MRLPNLGRKDNLCSPMNIPTADHLTQSSVFSSQFSSRSSMEQNDPPAVPCFYMKYKAVRERRAFIGKLTICFLTSRKGSFLTLAVRTLPRAAYFWKPAPGNQLGTYFTAQRICERTAKNRASVPTYWYKVNKPSPEHGGLVKVVTSLY